MSERPYRPPAGWAPQAGLLLRWPRDAAQEAVHLQVAIAAARREDVVIACEDPAQARHVRGRLDAAGIDPARVRLHVVAGAGEETARGPVTVVRDELPLLLSFDPAGAREGTLVRRLHALGAFAEAPLAGFELALTGELETDGAGTLLFARDARPGDAELRALFGLERVLRLEGLGDALPVRFLDAATIVHATCEDYRDPSFAPLQALAGALEQLRTGEHAPYRLVGSPPHQLGFLLINDAVLVPHQGDPAADERVASWFPGRDVITIETGVDLRTVATPLPLPLSLGPGTA